MIDKKEGLKNFCINIKPIIFKIKHKNKLSLDELKQILEFYREVTYFIYAIDQKGEPNE